MSEHRKIYIASSWKNDTLAGTDQPMGSFLIDRLSGEFEEYINSGDSSELVDIANICAMLWCRASLEAKETKVKDQ